MGTYYLPSSTGSYDTSNDKVKYRIVIVENSFNSSTRKLNITVKAYFWRTNTGYTTDYTHTLKYTINGTEYKYDNAYGSYPITNSGIYMNSCTVDVPVNDDGSVSITAYCQYTSTNSSNLTTSNNGGSISLTKQTASTASFNLNILLPDGSEPYTTGIAGTVQFSSNGGSSYTPVYNEPANSYTIGTVFKFKNFSPGTGLKLSSVTGASLGSDGVYTATLTSSGLTVNFYTEWQTYELKIDPNGGYRVSDGNTSIINVNKAYGTQEAINERKKNGYILTGYTMTNSNNNSTSDLGGASLEFNSSTKTATFTQGTVPVTLVAQWKSKDTQNIYIYTDGRIYAREFIVSDEFYIDSTGDIYAPAFNVGILSIDENGVTASEFITGLPD